MIRRIGWILLAFCMMVNPAAAEEAETVEENRIIAQIGEYSFEIILEDNESAAALLALLADGPMTVPCSNYGGFEKVCRLGKTLPSDDTHTETEAGDVMLYAGNQIVIFHASNAWAYTRLGRVDASYLDQLKDMLSGPETEITFSLPAASGTLLDIVLPSALNHIEQEAFAGNTKLESVRIPGAVTSIGANAFANCTGLTAVRIDGTPVISSTAFSGCDRTVIYTDASVIQAWAEANNIPWKSIAEL